MAKASSKTRELCTSLQQRFDAQDYAGCVTMITALKRVLIEDGLFQPALDDDAIEDSVMARTALELSSLASIRVGDTENFSRLAHQLGPWYDAKNLPASANRSTIIGLGFLDLLAESRIAEFHSRLETLDEDLLYKDDVYMGWVIRLETAIMEGAFDRVSRMIKECPSDDFSIYMNVVMSMVQSEIASCSERAYDSLAVESCVSLLLLNDASELAAFASERGWVVLDGNVYFRTADREGAMADADMEDDSVPANPRLQNAADRALISHALEYASELEQIV